MTTTAASEDRIGAGNEALARADWDGARRHFEAALAEHDAPEAWEGLAWAGWWLADEELTLSARERACRNYQAAGRRSDAARAAAWLASDVLDFRGDHAVMAGWLARARRLLDGEPPGADHGWLALMEAEYAMHVLVDPAAAGLHARAAAGIGRAHAVADLEAVGTAIEGITRVQRGRVEEGMRQLDEATALASHERFVLAVSPGWALCFLVSACEGVGDLPRATQWCEAMGAWAGRWRSRHMMGVCRTAYGGVLTTGGDWAAAESELTAAVDDLATTRPPAAARGLVRLAALRARQGRDDEARRLFARALPHPAAIVGLGDLDLHAGDPRSAREAADRVLRATDPGAILDRLPALELLARAEAAIGEAARAAAAARELAGAAATLGTPYLRGRAGRVAAELAAACGDDETARREAEDAIDCFARSQAPHDAAVARLTLAAALRRLGREDAAEREAATARAALERLGAAGDLRREAPRELSARELEVLRLVTHGLSDHEIAGRLVLSPHTVHRHVANVRTKLRQPSRAAAVAYAARAGLLE